MIDTQEVANYRGTEKDPLVLQDRSCTTSDITLSSEDFGELGRQQGLAQARRLLYVSHLFSQFSEVAWQFCLVLFLAACSNYESLFLVSTFGLTGGIFLCLFGSWAGKFVDGTNRLFAAQRFIWTENLCVVIATVFCYLLLGMHQPAYTRGYGDHLTKASEPVQSRYEGLPRDATSIFLLVGIHLLGAVAGVLDRGFLVAIERDWVVVMSKLATHVHDSKDSITGKELSPSLQSTKQWLTETNVAMKQIDLSCKVVAPAVSGFIIGAFDNGSGGENHGYNLRGAAILVGAVNAAALVVEYTCTARIYVLVPDLAHKENVQEKSALIGSEGKMHLTCNENCCNGPHERLIANSDDTPPRVKGRVKDGQSWLCAVPDELRVYLRQPVALGGIGLAFLYLNVLTFGGVMTAYLLWRGMRLETVGTWRGISSAVGLLGTLVYHTSTKWLSQESTGMWSICFQFCCISISFVSLWVKNYDLFLVMFIGGVCLSRVGLWVFDISLTQLMQERVASESRGVVGGVQQSLNAFFGLLSSALGLVFPDPRQFAIYVGTGYVSVGVATVLYFIGVFLPSRLSTSVVTELRSKFRRLSTIVEIEESIENSDAPGT